MMYSTKLPPPSLALHAPASPLLKDAPPTLLPRTLMLHAPTPRLTPAEPPSLPACSICVVHLVSAVWGLRVWQVQVPLPSLLQSLGQQAGAALAAAGAIAAPSEGGGLQLLPSVISIADVVSQGMGRSTVGCRS